MRMGAVVLYAVLAAFWLLGLWNQLHSTHSAMRYLALSLGLVAIAVWRWQPRRKLQPQEHDRQRDRRPPQR